jgi:hypothetical protein
MAIGQQMLVRDAQFGPNFHNWFFGGFARDFDIGFYGHAGISLMCIFDILGPPPMLDFA